MRERHGFLAHGIRIGEGFLRTKKKKHFETTLQAALKLREGIADHCVIGMELLASGMGHGGGGEIGMKKRLPSPRMPCTVSNRLSLFNAQLRVP